MVQSYMVEQMARCDRCGACCRHSLLEADVADAIREPALWDKGLVMDGHGKLEDEAEWCISLNHGAPTMACVFLEGNACPIYPTRPAMCVAHLPGSPRCTDSRKAEGLAPIPLVEALKDAEW